MNDDYLWDGSGEPDPEVQKLESALRGLRHNRPAPAFPEIAEISPAGKRSRLLTFLRPRFKIAALRWAAVLLIASAGLILYRMKPGAAAPSEWSVTGVQ